MSPTCPSATRPALQTSVQFPPQGPSQGTTAAPPERSSPRGPPSPNPITTGAFLSAPSPTVGLRTPSTRAPAAVTLASLHRDKVQLAAAVRRLGDELQEAQEANRALRLHVAGLQQVQRQQEEMLQQAGQDRDELMSLTHLLCNQVARLHAVRPPLGRPRTSMAPSLERLAAEATLRLAAAEAAAEQAPTQPEADPTAGGPGGDGTKNSLDDGPAAAQTGPNGASRADTVREAAGCFQVGRKRAASPTPPTPSGDDSAEQTDSKRLRAAPPQT